VYRLLIGNVNFTYAFVTLTAPVSNTATFIVSINNAGHCKVKLRLPVNYAFADNGMVMF